MFLRCSSHISGQSAVIPEIRRLPDCADPALSDESMDLGRRSWFDRVVSTGSETIQNAPDGNAPDGPSLDPTEALRHERRVSAALREVGVALGTTFDLDDLLELIL